MQELKMPKMGITMEEGTIANWIKNVGDKVNLGEPLYEVETDKQTVVIESPFAGTLKEILLNAGETAKVNDVIGIIED